MAEINAAWASSETRPGGRRGTGRTAPSRPPRPRARGRRPGATHRPRPWRGRRRETRRRHPARHAPAAAAWRRGPGRRGRRRAAARQPAAGRSCRSGATSAGPWARSRGSTRATSRGSRPGARARRTARRSSARSRRSAARRRPTPAGPAPQARACSAEPGLRRARRASATKAAIRSRASACTGLSAWPSLRVRHERAAAERGHRGLRGARSARTGPRSRTGAAPGRRSPASGRSGRRRSRACRRVDRVGQADEPRVRVRSRRRARDPDARDRERRDPPAERVAADDHARLVGDLRLVRRDRVLRLALRQPTAWPRSRGRAGRPPTAAWRRRCPRRRDRGRYGSWTAPYPTGPLRWYHRRTVGSPPGHGPRRRPPPYGRPCPLPDASAAAGPGPRAAPRWSAVAARGARRRRPSRCPSPRSIPPKPSPRGLARGLAVRTSSASASASAPIAASASASPTAVPVASPERVPPPREPAPTPPRPPHAHADTVPHPPTPVPTAPPAMAWPTVGDHARHDVDVLRPRLGHGVGLNQYGAKGRALAGQTAEQILAAYFKGAKPAHRQPDPERAGPRPRRLQRGQVRPARHPRARDGRGPSTAREDVPRRRRPQAVALDGRPSTASRRPPGGA